jgi:hypothetical protein
MDHCGCGSVAAAAIADLNSLIRCGVFAYNVQVGDSTGYTASDDDCPLSKVVAALLAGAGFRVLVAGSAATAFKICRQARIDLLMTSLSMPDFARASASHARCEHVPRRSNPVHVGLR